MLVALFVLLLILLPLYLWPLRGSPSGLPSTSGRSGAVGDPRSPAAVAQIPGDVWDALMGGGGAPPPSSAAAPAEPRNLTMIAELEDLTGSGLAVGSPFPESAAALARGMITQLEALSDVSDGGSGAYERPSTPGQLLAGDPAGGSGAGPWPIAFPPGGYPSLDNVGPWTGGGPGGIGHRSIPTPMFDLGGVGPPQPTPEPATLILVGSNLVLLGTAAWKRRRRGAPPIG